MRRLVVFNTKGGVGKSTIACSLATTLSRHGLAVILCDADPQGSTTAWFNLGHRRGLAETMNGQLDPRFAAVKVAPGLRVVPTGDTDQLTRLAKLRPGELPPYLDALEADVLIIDTAAGLNGLTVSLLRHGRPEVLVPLPVSGGYLPLAALPRVWAQLGDHVGREPDYLVPNMLDYRTSASGQVLEILRTVYGDYVTTPIRINSRLVHAAWGHTPPTDPKTVTDFAQLAESLYRRWEDAPAS